MEHWFEYESGLGWCESKYGKYRINSFVAEFWNAATALPIILLPLLNLYLVGTHYYKFVRKENPYCIAPCILVSINGVASAYYHSTLSMFGQMVDEISLIWLINVSIATHLPIMKCYPEKYRTHMNIIRLSIVLATLIVSALCFFKPSLNAFALMTISIPFAALVHYEGTKEANSSVAEVTNRTLRLWVAAMFFWVLDKLGCELWIFLGFPYMHALFHLLSSLAAYNALVLCSLLEINRRSYTPSRQLAHIRHLGKWFFRLPYISVQKYAMVD